MVVKSGQVLARNPPLRSWSISSGFDPVTALTHRVEPAARSWAFTAEPSFTKHNCSAEGTTSSKTDDMESKSDLENQISSYPHQDARQVYRTIFDFPAQSSCQLSTIE